MGTRSLSSPKINIKVSSTVQNLLNDSVPATCAHVGLSYSKTLTSGIGANQANRAWQLLNRSLANGAQEIIDLYNLTGWDIGAGIALDGVGQTLIFEEIVAIAIKNENAVTADGQLEIKPSEAQGWAPIGTHTAATGGALRGQGVLVKIQLAEAGYDVANGSRHRITLKAQGGAVNYSIYVMGRHDDEESSSSSSSSSSPSSSSESSASTSSISTSSSGRSSSSSSPSSSSQSSFSSSSSLSTSSSSLSSQS